MKPHSFRSAHRLAVAAISLLIVDIACYFVEIIYNIVFISYFPDLGESESLTNSEMAMSFLALGLLSLKVVAYIATIVVFLIWLHRVYKNLIALNVQSLQVSPGWAVGYWFIPIVNLFKPLQIVNEVYHGSNSEDLKDGYGFSNTSTTMLLGFWWACWLASNVAGRIASALEKAAKDVTQTSVVVYIASLSFGIMAGLLLIFVIQEIDRRQAECEKRFVLSQPPLPPTFGTGY
jgi:hypothetical protein